MIYFNEIYLTPESNFLHPTAVDFIKPIDRVVKNMPRYIFIPPTGLLLGKLMKSVEDSPLMRVLEPLLINLSEDLTPA